MGQVPSGSGIIAGFALAEANDVALAGFRRNLTGIANSIGYQGQEADSLESWRGEVATLLGIQIK